MHQASITSYVLCPQVLRSLEEFREFQNVEGRSSRTGIFLYVGFVAKNLVYLRYDRGRYLGKNLDGP